MMDLLEIDKNLVVLNKFLGHQNINTDQQLADFFYFVLHS
jgi:hypothetical protein